MPRVRYTADGGSYKHREGVAVDPDNPEVDADGEMAEYLVAEWPFEYVDESDGGDEDAGRNVTAFAFNDGEELKDLTVDEVRTRLQTGQYDRSLGDIESAEQHGADRSTVYDAIDARREE